MISNDTKKSTTTPLGGNPYEKHTIKQLETITGTLSQPSKMPCHGYSIPAKKCITGKKLQTVANSVCSGCYALKGRYSFNNVQSALNTRYESLIADPHRWQLAITELIRRKEKSGYFRWHDSGDIQGEYHLTHINNIALALPHIQFWIPTRETRILNNWLKDNIIADNLIVRVSSFFINQIPNKNFDYTSTVGWDEASNTCPSYKQNNSCADCRQCWQKEYRNINYKLH